jgi:hypothetical protein
LQGFLFSPPVAAERISELARQAEAGLARAATLHG